MTLQIISPEGILLSAKVKSVTLPGIDGIFTVLHNHAPLLSILIKGIISYDGSKDHYQIEQGIAEVRDNIVTVYI